MKQQGTTSIKSKFADSDWRDSEPQQPKGQYFSLEIRLNTTKQRTLILFV